MERDWKDPFDELPQIAYDKGKEWVKVYIKTSRGCTYCSYRDIFNKNGHRIRGVFYEPEPEITFNDVIGWDYYWKKDRK